MSEDEQIKIPWHAWPLLLQPRRVLRGLERVAAGGLPTPNLWQVELGLLRMWQRILFRSETIGTCSGPLRSTRRAKLLSWRFFRFFGLVWERAIKPWDLTGLLSPAPPIFRHLIGAHHDRHQCVYDLQLLSLHPGGLAELHSRVVAVVSGADPRADWLRDLVAYEGYHEHLLRCTERVLAGEVELDPRDSDNPDISFYAWLRWAIRQPPSPGATWRAWREGRYTLEGGVS